MRVQLARFLENLQECHIFNENAGFFTARNFLNGYICRSIFWQNKYVRR